MRALCIRRITRAIRNSRQKARTNREQRDHIELTIFLKKTATVFHEIGDSGDEMFMSRINNEFKKTADLTALLLLFILIATPTNGQTRPSGVDDTVIIKTWSQGSDILPDSTYHISLGRNLEKYEIDIKNVTGTRTYRLQLVRESTFTPLRKGIDCWVVYFNEVVKDKNGPGSIVKYNLLTTEGPGVGDNLPKEDRAGSFCALEPPNRLFDDLFFKPNVRRTFEIDGYTLNIEADTPYFDAKTNRITQLEIDIGIKRRVLSPGGANRKNHANTLSP